MHVGSASGPRVPWPCACAQRLRNALTLSPHNSTLHSAAAPLQAGAVDAIIAVSEIRRDCYASAGPRRSKSPYLSESKARALSARLCASRCTRLSHAGHLPRSCWTSFHRPLRKQIRRQTRRRRAERTAAGSPRARENATPWSEVLPWPRARWPRLSPPCCLLLPVLGLFPWAGSFWHCPQRWACLCHLSLPAALASRCENPILETRTLRHRGG